MVIDTAYSSSKASTK